MYSFIHTTTHFFELQGTTEKETHSIHELVKILELKGGELREDVGVAKICKI